MTVIDPKTRQLQELFCAKCHETITQGNIIEDTPTIASAPVKNSSDKKQFVAILRDEINNLQWSAAYDRARLATDIKNILSLIVDYIENNLQCLCPFFFLL